MWLDRMNVVFKPWNWNAFVCCLKSPLSIPIEHPRDGYILVIEWLVLLRLTGCLFPCSHVLIVDDPLNILLTWCLEEYAQRFWKWGQTPTSISYFDLILLLIARLSRYEWSMGSERSQREWGKLIRDLEMDLPLLQNKGWEWAWLPAAVLGGWGRRGQ